MSPWDEAVWRAIHSLIHRSKWQSLSGIEEKGFRKKIGKINERRSCFTLASWRERLSERASERLSMLVALLLVVAAVAAALVLAVASAGRAAASAAAAAARHASYV